MLVALTLARRANDLYRTNQPEFLNAQTESYQAAGQTKPRELAFADFAQVLMSLNEFVYVD